MLRGSEMSTFEVVVLTASHPHWPSQLTTRLENATPASLAAIGYISLLANRKIALFCSVRCPGDAILAAQDAARRWRDEGRCIISGFHSPVEKECLDVLLGGASPLIICPARSLHGMQFPQGWKKPIEAGRLLLLSFFPSSERRLTAELAQRRNECVAALADEAFIAYITPGGQTARIADMLKQWHVPAASLA